MASVSRSALVRHSPAQMYGLVNDVANYPEFLPWCTATEILAHGDHEMVARLHLAWGGFRRTFTTRNRLQPTKMIEIRLVDGPFHHLEGFWRFQPLGEGACKVALDMEFEFSNAFVGTAFGPVFAQIADSLVGSFVRRAEAVHGDG